MDLHGAGGNMIGFKCGVMGRGSFEKKIPGFFDDGTADTLEMSWRQIRGVDMGSTCDVALEKAILLRLCAVQI